MNVTISPLIPLFQSYRFKMAGSIAPVKKKPVAKRMKAKWKDLPHCDPSMLMQSNRAIDAQWHWSESQCGRT
jgi:hypothetical protein